MDDELNSQELMSQLVAELGSLSRRLESLERTIAAAGLAAGNPRPMHEMDSRDTSTWPRSTRAALDSLAEVMNRPGPDEAGEGS